MDPSLDFGFHQNLEEESEFLPGQVFRSCNQCWRQICYITSVIIMTSWLVFACFVHLFHYEDITASLCVLLFIHPQIKILSLPNACLRMIKHFIHKIASYFLWLSNCQQESSSTCMKITELTVYLQTATSKHSQTACMKFWKLINQNWTVRVSVSKTKCEHAQNKRHSSFYIVKKKKWCK